MDMQKLPALPTEPTSGKEWRKARTEGKLIWLMSQKAVRVRPIEVDYFLRVGHIPDFLAPVVNELITGGQAESELLPLEELEKKKEWFTFLDDLCCYAFVSPRVVDNPEADDEISLDDIAYVDKYFIYVLFSRPARLLRQFRQPQTQPVAHVASPADNGHATIEAVKP